MNAYEKLREACESLCKAAFKVLLRYGNNGEETGELAICVDNARSALAIPRRNCEVGTAKEKSRRFKAFCRYRHGEPCGGCPAQTIGFRSLTWGHLPYDENKKGEDNAKSDILPGSRQEST